MRMKRQILTSVLLLAFLGGSVALVLNQNSLVTEAQDSVVATSTRLSIGSATVPVDGIASLEIRADILPIRDPRDGTGTTSPSGLGGFTLLVTPMDSSVVQVIGFDVPSYGLSRADTVGVIDGSGAMRLSVADLSRIAEPGMTDFLMAIVKVEGLATGVTAIEVVVLEVADEFGFPFQITGTIGTVTVSASRDLDGDGLTEDCNGNGIFDFTDIVCWFELKIAP